MPSSKKNFTIMKFKEEQGISLEHMAQERFQMDARAQFSICSSSIDLKTTLALYSAAYMANSRIFKIVLR